MSSWLCSRSIVAIATMALAAVCGASCTPEACVRNSDCPSGLVCGAGMCTVPPADTGEGGAPRSDGAAGERDASADSGAAAPDAGDAGDAAVSTMDGMVDGGSDDGDGATDAGGSADATSE